MQPRFIGLGRPQLTLVSASMGSPPDFAPGSTHTAQVTLKNLTSMIWGFKGEVYLDGRIASSGIVEFTMEGGAQRSIDFPVVMPGAGTYQAFLDVSVGEEVVLHHPFDEAVVISAVAPPPPGAGEAVFYGTILERDHVTGIPGVRVTWRNGSAEVSTPAQTAITDAQGYYVVRLKALPWGGSYAGTWFSVGLEKSGYRTYTNRYWFEPYQWHLKADFLMDRI